MSYNASADLWYQYFSADGSQSLILLAFYGCRAMWASLGLIFNIGMVYVTLKSKTLRGICNILLALESSFSIVLDASYYVSFLVVASGAKFIRLEYCFWFQILPIMLGDGAQMTMVCTGVDRLCAVLFPVWYGYKRRNAKCYLSFIGALLCCYVTYDFIINYIDYSNTKDIMLSCSPHEMAQGAMGTLMKINGLTLSGILMTVYTLCWFMVFQLTATAKTVNENNRKLIKSLIFIIGLNLIGVFIKTSVNLTFQNFVKVNVFVKTSFTITFSFLTIAVYGANAPVLYTVSNEYRARFNEHLPWLPKLLGKQSDRPSDVTVVPSTTVSRPWVSKTHYTMDAANRRIQQHRRMPTF